MSNAKWIDKVEVIVTRVNTIANVLAFIGLVLAVAIKLKLLFGGKKKPDQDDKAAAPTAKVG